MTDALLATSTPITGLDRSIVISPARLHLTLGVMSLSELPTGITDEAQTALNPNSEPSQAEKSTLHKTISDAVNLLQELKPEIQHMLDNQPIQLTLDELTVMRRSPSGEADVMYIGPASSLAKSEEHSCSVKLLRKRSQHKQG
jgi:activating signal cointegrator complex subunit 1